MTRAGRLNGKYVVHAVGPVWNEGKNNEAEDLYHCYQKSLYLADSYQATSIAFPAINTGIYRFPNEKAARIALDSTRAYLQATKVA
ncbi:macro domain-containing protein [Mechercharimyces sp. CAU 1602]|uniref:macro domain-containing protein n=1 Tax=Mechercharimyces sp. CAU 1602 TaxID=2973933 RepID=UPI002162040D|nr:macro domain-containing protein [Mechercharimyces sp. CAU 1602]MCS1350230.1 macro domain-containing protein [Mechercharimyces sp. CAU 1602]